MYQPHAEGPGQRGHLQRHNRALNYDASESPGQCDLVYIFPFEACQRFLQIGFDVNHEGTLI